MKLFQNIGISLAVSKVVTWLERRGWSRSVDESAKVRTFFESLVINLLELEAGPSVADYDKPESTPSWRKTQRTTQQKPLKKLRKARKAP